MPKRRLVLAREALTVLEPADLASVAGAAGITNGEGSLCEATQTGSLQYSQCPTCGIACTANCPTRDC